MPKMHVNESTVIQVPVEKVYNILNNFNHWNAWSPWLILDPESRMKVSEDAKYYEWEGKRIGSGNMKITAEEAYARISYDLNFLTPWKSHADVRFEVKEEGGGTKVNWIMDSSLPFYLFFMTRMMTSFISMDFKRGLNMLKEYAEEGTVYSKLDFKGASDFNGNRFVGISTSCAMDALSNQMKSDFEKLGNFAGSHKESIAGPPFSIYHKWDIVNGKVQYTSAFPVKEVPADLPAGLITGEIPATKVHTVKHTGPYLHLGNAWGAMYNMQRAKVFKMNKKVHPFEIYHNMPGEVPDKELVTEIHFAVK